MENHGIVKVHLYFQIKMYKSQYRYKIKKNLSFDQSAEMSLAYVFMGINTCV